MKQRGGGASMLYCVSAAQITVSKAGYKCRIDYTQQWDAPMVASYPGALNRGKVSLVFTGCVSA